MKVWMKVSQGIKPIPNKEKNMTNKSITELKDIHKGEDIWVIGAGPSMNFVDPSFFENKICISVNQMYEKFPCEYVVGRDFHSKARWAPTIEDLRDRDDIKLLYSELDTGHRRERNMDWGWMSYSDNFYEFQSGEDHNLDNVGTDRMACIRTTLNTCLNIAAYMGAKNIMICGKDEGAIDGKLYVDDYTKKGWHDSEAWGEIKRWLAQTEHTTKKMKDKLIEVYGCNVHSLNPFINYKLEGHEYRPTTKDNKLK